MEENRQYCKRIACEIEAYDTGSVWKCPECGETVEADERAVKLAWGTEGVLICNTTV